LERLSNKIGWYKSSMPSTNYYIGFYIAFKGGRSTYSLYDIKTFSAGGWAQDYDINFL